MVDIPSPDHSNGEDPDAGDPQALQALAAEEQAALAEIDPAPPEIDPAALEALLFVSPGPVTPAQLAAALESEPAAVDAALERLERSYSEPENRRGIRVQRYRGRVQLVTAPGSAAAVERFLGLDAGTRLSRPALEALAIILYRQPVTRPQIDAVRGVNSDGVIKGLQMKGLVQEVGRAELPGRPILYSATPECLQYFGLTSLAELPPLNLDEVIGETG